MPLVRYEIRNEYSLANSELYRSAGKDEPQALLEGVAMAGLVGIVRQLGDLAEFAAEIFHDLHEEVMATAARGHGLMIRVQQLEAEFPSVEKALMSEKNHLRFAYAMGADWHASIRNDQNHLTQGDLPRFILNSYEECRGPPRLFLLDKFDVAGAGACLKRYTDPSFFKMEWASTELMKAEKAQRDKKARRVKKKGRRRRTGDTADATPNNGRVRYSSLDLDHPKRVPISTVNMSNQKLKSKEIDKSSLPKQQSERYYMKGTLKISSPQRDEHKHNEILVGLDKKLNSKHLNASPVRDQVIDKHYVEDPCNKSLSNEDAQESSSREWEEKPAVRVVTSVKRGNDLTMISSTVSQSPMIVAEVDTERMPQNIIQSEQKGVLAHDEGKPDTHVVENENDDVGSEPENYMDALATMESETETDSESKPKQEVDSDINSEHKETGRKLFERHAEYSEFANAEATAFYNCDSSDESSKVEALLEFFYKPADISSSAESMSKTVNATSECASATVDLNSRLDSGPLSLVTLKEDLAYAFDDGNLLSAENCKNVQVPLDKEVHELHTQFSLCNDAEDHTLNNCDLLLKSSNTENLTLNNCDSLFKSSNTENSLVVSNSKPTDVSSHDESMLCTLNTTSECTDMVDQNRRLYPEDLSVENLKDLVFSFDDETSIHLEALENGQGLKDNQMVSDEKMHMEANLTAEEGMLDGSDFSPIDDARCTIVTVSAEHDKFENEDLSSALQNKDGTGAFTNSAAIVGIDNAEVSFRFPTFDSSILGIEELQILHEPAAISECFEGIESGCDLQASFSEVNKDENYGNYCSFPNSDILESAGNSVLAGGIEYGMMQGSQKYIDVEANDGENEVLESINNDSCGSQYVQLLSVPSSPKLGGKISPESDLNIEFGEYLAESKPQDSSNDEYIEAGIDSDIIDEKDCPDKPLHLVPSAMQTIVAELEEPGEHEYEEESLKPVGGFQDNDLAQLKSPKSECYIRSLDMPPLSNVLDGCKGNQVSENYSCDAPIIEDIVACSGVNQNVSSNGTDLLLESVVDHIPMKEVSIYSEEPVAVETANVKSPFLAFEADNACRKELCDEIPHVETSVNNGVLPDGSPHSRSIEFCSDGGAYENGKNIESDANHDLREPTELFGSSPSANSFSKIIQTGSSHVEAEMQILYAIPPVKPNATPCHRRSLQNNSDGISFESNIDTDSHGNHHLVASSEEFGSSVSAKSLSETVYTGSLHADQDMHLLHFIPPVKPVGAEPHAESPKNLPKTENHDFELPSHFIPPGEPVGAQLQAESPKTLPKTEVYGSELPSPPLEHIRISFPPGSDSPLSMYSLSSDHVSESPSIEKNQPSESKADNLSSFHLLPEPAIPLQQVDENQTIGIMGSLSLHRKRKSSDVLSDKMHISQMRDIDGDSEDEGWKEFGKSSPEAFHEFYNQSLEPTDGLQVFSGRTEISDADTGSPGVLSTISRTSSLSPETTRNSILNLKYSSADAGSSMSHSRNISLGSSPRSLAVSEPHSPVSGEETFHGYQYLSWSHSSPIDIKAPVQTFSSLQSNSEHDWNDISPPLEIRHKSEDLPRVHSSTLELTSTLEPNSESNFHEMPPPPPLPPSERQIMKSYEMPSVTFLGVEPPIPPAFPPPLTMPSIIQDPSPSLVPATQMSSNEQNDSLIEAIASHDKATLKKVAKDIHNISTKPVDEREELLEQIRTRSFNLRHTPVVKPNIPRPATNINVAAILEKANAIRQAFAGSDEDDEDDEDWSDT